ncbi:MAG: SLC13 family permease [bacterium]|nr:SLC13 family permease [bacterium]
MNAVSSVLQQAIAWTVLFFALYAISTGKIKYEVAAFGGLLVLGLLRIGGLKTLFSGFANPALFTVAAVLVMSAGIVESGVLSGLGRSIAKRVKQPNNQIVALASVTAGISAFMNNVGAIGLVLPAATRMATRARVKQATYAMPLIYASILGGSTTLIGTASNVIVSNYRFQAFGQHFKMFDFAAHGLGMVAMGMLVLAISRLIGSLQLKGGNVAIDIPKSEPLERQPERAMPQRTRKNTIIVVGSLGLAIIFASFGLVHPSIGFGLVVMALIATKILPYKLAYQALNLPVLIFLGSMLSIANILEETGALSSLLSTLIPLTSSLSPYLLVLVFILVTAVLANLIDNSVAAVLMAPIAISLFFSGAVSVSANALLMAVAAGSSLGLVLPTHQATIVTMSKMEISRGSFIKGGLVIAVLAAIVAAGIITYIW